MRHESSNDDNLNVLDNTTMSSLTKLDNLRVLHLLGFAGRQNRYRRYLFTDLDNAVESLAQKGKLEEFHFSQSGVTYKGVFALIRHCKNLRFVGFIALLLCTLVAFALSPIHESDVCKFQQKSIL